MKSCVIGSNECRSLTVLCEFQDAADGDPKTSFPVRSTDAQARCPHEVTDAPSEHNFTLCKVEGYLPLFGLLNSPVIFFFIIISRPSCCCFFHLSFPYVCQKLLRVCVVFVRCLLIIATFRGRVRQALRLLHRSQTSAVASGPSAEGPWHDLLSYTS